MLRCVKMQFIAAIIWLGNIFLASLQKIESFQSTCGDNSFELILLVCSWNV